MIAALLAALMGGMASVFNSASTLVTLDFYKKIRPQANEKQLVNFGRIATGVMVVLGLAVGAVHSPDQQPALHLSAERAGLHQPADRGVLHPRNSVDAHEWRGRDQFPADRIRARHGALRRGNLCRSRALEFSGVMLWLVKVNFLHYAIFMFVVCSLVLVVVSMMTPAPDRRKLAGLTFATVDDKMDTIAVAACPSESQPERRQRSTG